MALTQVVHKPIIFEEIFLTVSLGGIHLAEYQVAEMQEIQCEAELCEETISCVLEERGLDLSCFLTL